MGVCKKLNENVTYWEYNYPNFNHTTWFFFSFSGIGPVADLMSASSTYLDKNSCYNSQVYAAHNYGTPPHCYYSNMDYLSSGVTHSPLNVPVILSSRIDLLLKPEKSTKPAVYFDQHLGAVHSNESSFLEMF